MTKITIEIDIDDSIEDGGARIKFATTYASDFARTLKVKPGRIEVHEDNTISVFGSPSDKLKITIDRTQD